MKNRDLKRKYITPTIITFSVDREISLIMMTDENTPPDPPVRGAPMPNSQFEQSKLNDNPFDEKY